jgi:hypothetical protein
MADTEHFETFGVPTYYINVAVPEPAGGGNVRIWNCARKHGLLIPQCEIIMPAVDLLIAGRAVAEAATESFNDENMGSMRLAS